MKSITINLFVCCGLLTSTLAARAEDGDLAARAQAVLKTNCLACHGSEKRAANDFHYLMDREQLIAEKKIVPGKPDESELYQRAVKGEMPPEGKQPRPGKQDLDVLKRWIAADAALPPVVVAERKFISNAAIAQFIHADLQVLQPRQRRFARYFTLTHLYNAGVAEEELQTARHALTKLLNSLSWHSRIALPQSIDPARTIFRIDLRDYKWNARTWERIAGFYPYRVAYVSNEVKAIAAGTGTELPQLRADWFVATASRPPLYHDVLQLPGNDRALERMLQVEVPANIQEDSVLRAGFNGSGVSKNNRLIERHDAAYGAYWRSYDFADNSGRQNLFEHPLGPTGTGPNPDSGAFEHAGGEIIFNLPNGLQAYMLVDRRGQRIDKAPVDIVSDPKRPDRQVENGLSCMSCHVRGMIPAADQVRAHVEKNLTAFTRTDVESIRAIYPSATRMRNRMKEDTERFEKALGKLSVAATEPEPIVVLAVRHENVLDLASAAAEVGLTPAEFSKRLRGSAALTRSLGALNTKGGTIQRQVILDGFSEIIREFRLIEAPYAVASGGQKPAEVRAPSVANPFAGHTGHVLCIAISPDGRLAVSGSDDRSVRLWEIASGKQLQSFTGHTDEVVAVAFSPDGRRILSGSRDRTVRLWNTDNGRAESRERPGEVFTGHTDKVLAVAFAPDGKHILSAGEDRTMRLWDLQTGKVVRIFEGHQGPVSAVAFTPNGLRVVSGSHDKTIRIWRTRTGQEVHCLEGHEREVSSLAVSADGRRILSGSQDRTARLWNYDFGKGDYDSGKEVQCLKNHPGVVIRVAFAADGKSILTGTSQYQGKEPVIRRWNPEAGSLIDTFAGDAVWSVAFAPDGRTALTGTSEKRLRLWKLWKSK